MLFAYERKGIFSAILTGNKVVDEVKRVDYNLTKV